jgi:hypothetical protein
VDATVTSIIEARRPVSPTAPIDVTGLISQLELLITVRGLNLTTEEHRAIAALEETVPADIRSALASIIRKALFTTSPR